MSVRLRYVEKEIVALNYVWPIESVPGALRIASDIAAHVLLCKNGRSVEQNVTSTSHRMDCREITLV